MSRSRTIRALRPWLDQHPRLRERLRRMDVAWGRWQHAAAERFPGVIRPEPRQLTVAVTAACNLECDGCRYGRDFMLGARLPTALLLDLLEDARAAGVGRVRFYGGEPLLHPGLATAVRRATELGLESYVTTNGLLLGERIEELRAAGLGWASVGFYGVGERYDRYTRRPGRFERLVASLSEVRERCGTAFDLQLNYVLLRPTTNLEALREAWEFAQRFGMVFHLDLYGYSIPFFSDGPDRALAYLPEDRSQVEEVARELVRLKERFPDRIVHSTTFLRSVPDWLLLGAAMRVPCDAYQLLWVGADGSVQLCDVAFPLGNLHRTRLGEMLFGEAHRRAARDAFLLRCPNCTCKCESRTVKHPASVRRYGT